MSPHVRYDILLANLYFKNIHQSEDFQEGRGMNLESVVELAELGGCGVWGGRGGGGRRGGEAHPSFPSSPGWRDSCGPPEEEEEEETSICFNFSSTSKHAEGIQRPRERSASVVSRPLVQRQARLGIENGLEGRRHSAANLPRHRTAALHRQKHRRRKWI